MISSSKNLLILSLILLFLTITTACSTKNTVQKPRLRYATKAQLENCVGDIDNNKETLIYHKLKKGETVFRLSKIYGSTVDEILNLNHIQDINDIPIGTTLLIRSTSGISKFSWPLNGQITSKFGRRKGRFHYGIDIAARKGTKIRSAARGVVILSGYKVDGFRGYGKLVVLQHNENTVSLYAHNNNNYVLQGNCVAEGEVIGEVGSTGRSTGPHLHFEIRKNKKAVDPYIFLKKE